MLARRTITTLFFCSLAALGAFAPGGAPVVRKVTFSDPPGVPTGHLPMDGGRLFPTSQNFIEDDVFVEAFWLRNSWDAFDQGHFHHLELLRETFHGFETDTGFGPDEQGVYLELAEGGVFDLISFDYRADYSQSGQAEVFDVHLQVAPDLDPTAPVFPITLPAIEDGNWHTLAIPGVWDTEQVFLTATMGLTAVDQMRLDNVVVGLAEDVASEDFESASFDGGSGNWLGPWEVDGDVRIGSVIGEQSRVCRIKDSGALTRALDLSGLLNQRLTIEVMVINYEDDDRATIEASSDGVVFTPVLELSAADSDGVFHSHLLDLGAVAASETFELRVVTETSGATPDYLMIDDVVVRGVVTLGDLPVADAGDDLDSLVEPGADSALVELDGGASYDPDGVIVAYEWSEGGIPLADTPIATLDLDLGVHELLLTVEDDLGNRSNDGLRVAVNPPTVAHDGFESADLLGGSGAWIAPWTPAGNVMVGGGFVHEGLKSVRIKDSGSLERIALLPGAVDVRLRFWAWVLSYEPGDVARVLVSSDGIAYTTLYEFTDADSDDSYHYFDFDLSGMGLTFESGLHLLFITDTEPAGLDRDRFVIDSIEILGR
ncbi:MAG: hypothetical protein QGI46_15275 [Planctomycetota bacterium]|nr:hypothetical protein [Planctomycetota bacterium]